MAFESDKIMFEVYKEATYTGRYRVVYFTELQDHNKEFEISRAMAAGAHMVNLRQRRNLFEVGQPSTMHDGHTQIVD